MFFKQQHTQNLYYVLQQGIWQKVEMTLTTSLHMK